jgi:hypothetical protein
MNINIDKIRKFIEGDQFVISHHARIRMFERNVSTEILKELILGGEIIEKYVDDFPCPSILMLGFINKNPFHVVIAQCLDHIRIITVYKPDDSKWENYKIRKE